MSLGTDSQAAHVSKGVLKRSRFIYMMDPVRDSKNYVQDCTGILQLLRRRSAGSPGRSPFWPYDASEELLSGALFLLCVMGSSPANMVVVGTHFTFLLIVV